MFSGRTIATAGWSTRGHNGAASPINTHRPASTTIGHRIAAPASWASAASLAARLAKKHDAEGLGEAGGGQPADQRQPADDQHAHQRPRRRDAGLASEPRHGAKVDEELADKAVQRRQPGNCRRADQKGRARDRHALEKSAQPIEFPRAGGVQHRSGAEEQQALEDGMVDDVQQAAGQAQGRHRRVPVADPQNAHPQPQGDDADVFHAVVSQQPFQVVLRQGVEHAEDARNHADGHERPAPPRRRRPEQREHPQQPINPRLDHHAAHHGRHVRGRGGVGFRQPDVHRNEAGLRAEADHGQQEEDSAAAPPLAESRSKSSDPAFLPNSRNSASRKAVPRCMATR